MAWKPGDARPNRDTYPPGDAGTKAFDADDGAYQKWKNSQSKAVAPAGQAGEVKRGREAIHDPKTGAFLGYRDTVSGNVTGDAAGDDASTGALGAAAKAAAEKRKKAEEEEKRRLEEEAAKANRRGMK